VEVVSGAPWGYRLRTQLQVEAAPEGPPRVGYFRRGSHELVPVDRCPILVRELEGLLPRLPEALPAEPPRRLDLAVGSGAAWTTAPVVEGLPHGPVARTVAGHQLSYDARVFFQVHGGLLERLVERVVGPWSGAQAFDLYAGVGLFSLPLARLYDRVTAVEGDRIAARFCRNNGRKNRIGNLAVESRALESWIPNLPADVDRVVVDPPRAGLHRKLRSAFLERPPVRLTYVSCHPAALARDLKALARGFHLESLVLFDLFPQTGHMEAVAQLVAG
jgi:23S rRNA (uracil1939-C5)-methyltransferase